VLFAVQTLVLQARRRRRLADVTLDFWRLAMLSLLLAVGSWGALPFLPAARLELAVGLLFFVGFAVSAVNGMLYKIVPFLIWLHLNNRLQRSGRWQGRVPALAPPAALALLLSALGLWWNLLLALRLYRRLLREQTGGDVA
jgi:hypothetical protein